MLMALSALQTGLEQHLLFFKRENYVCRVILLYEITEVYIDSV